MIIGITGAVAAQVVNVQPHPNASRIWLAMVQLQPGAACEQVVFGGASKLAEGDWVPAAPPGSRAHESINGCEVRRLKKMRVRRYRGERSYGMLCSLDELGWLKYGPDEVAHLQDVEVGDGLDGFRSEDWPNIVKDWDRAREVALGAMVDKAVQLPLPPGARHRPEGRLATRRLDI